MTREIWLVGLGALVLGIAALGLLRLMVNQIERDRKRSGKQ